MNIFNIKWMEAWEKHGGFLWKWLSLNIWFEKREQLRNGEGQNYGTMTNDEESVKDGLTSGCSVGVCLIF